MSHPRRTARVLAVQVVFQLDVQGDSFLPEVRHFLKDQGGDPSVRAYARKLAEGAWRNRHGIDQQLTAAAEHWSLGRMTGLDRNVLRVALYEMSMPDAPPAKVVINEAIDIAKEYGSAESGAFVNGILDSIVREDRRQYT